MSTRFVTNGKKENFEKILLKARVVGVDTPVFIYQLENHPKFQPISETVLELSQEEKISLVTSVVTLSEILNKPFLYDREDLVDEYKLALLDSTGLETLEISVPIAVRASQIRAKYGIRLPDAFQVAACLAGGAKAFVTNDARLKKVKELEILCLSDFV